MGGDGNDFLQGTIGTATRIFGGNGADNIRVAGRRTRRSTPAPATTRSTRSRPAAPRPSSAARGNDTVIVSRFKGNRKRTKVAADCESRKKG